MGTNNLDGGPSPTSPLWHCAEARLALACACGPREVRPDQVFAGQDRAARLWRLAERLRCRRCGERPQVLDVRR